MTELERAADEHAWDLPQTAREVQVIKVRLHCIIDPERQILEWKVTSIAGTPPAIALMLQGSASGQQLDAAVGRMTQQLTIIMQEYCEPF